MIDKSVVAPLRAPHVKPLLVSGPVARRLIGVGNTKYHELVRDGTIRSVIVGNRRMIVYASLEALTNEPA